MTTILFVTELRVWPPYGGERIQAGNVIDGLSQLAEVTVLAPPLPPADCPLLSKVHAWHNLPGVPASFRRRLVASPLVLLPRPAWQRQLAGLVAEIRPQIVWFNYGHWGQYAKLAQRGGARAVMQTHNVQSRLAWQGLISRPLTRWHLYYAARYPLEAWHERTLFRRFDRVLSVSAGDRHDHARFVGDKASGYLPNFIKAASYQTDGTAPRETDLVVMTGNFGAFQNAVGAYWLIETVWPLVRRAVPEARLELIGGAPVAWQRRIPPTAGITCTGSVTSIGPYLRRATVAVAPLLQGSGTRFKILEALACETPVVSTTLGAEGLALIDGVHARLADTPANFAAAIIELLHDPVQCQRLAANGLARLQAEFTLTANLARLQQVIDELCEVQ